MIRSWRLLPEALLELTLNNDYEIYLVIYLFNAALFGVDGRVKYLMKSNGEIETPISTNSHEGLQVL